MAGYGQVWGRPIPSAPPAPPAPQPLPYRSPEGVNGEEAWVIDKFWKITKEGVDPFFCRLEQTAMRLISAGGDYVEIEVLLLREGIFELTKIPGDQILLPSTEDLAAHARSLEKEKVIRGLLNQGVTKEQLMLIGVSGFDIPA